MQGRLNEDRIELLQSYVRDAVARDVAERLGREDIRLANQFALYGLRNTACEFSVNQLVETSKSSVSRYIGRRRTASSIFCVRPFCS